MRILLLGKNGQVGWELQRTLAPLGEVVATGREEIDLSQPEQLRSVVRHLQPQVIVNGAAYTNVDHAESEPDLAMAINGVAPGILADEARQLGAALIHFSTDYVFDGRKGEPYVETDAPNPLNVYGASKLAGERAIQAVEGAYLILRTSWVYSLRRDCFVTKVLGWAREKDTLRVVNDQIGSPTWARMLAVTAALLLSKSHEDVCGWLREYHGLYHLCGKGAASRWEWAREILELDGQSGRVIEPASTAEFPRSARRPAFSALDCRRLGDTFQLRAIPWQASLHWAIADACYSH